MTDDPRPPDAPTGTEQPAVVTADGATHAAHDGTRDTAGDAVLTRNGERVEMRAALCFVVSLLAAVALAVV